MMGKTVQPNHALVQGTGGPYTSLRRPMSNPLPNIPTDKEPFRSSPSSGMCCKRLWEGIGTISCCGTYWIPKKLSKNTRLSMHMFHTSLELLRLCKKSGGLFPGDLQRWVFNGNEWFTVGKGLETLVFVGLLTPQIEPFDAHTHTHTRHCNENHLRTTIKWMRCPPPCAGLLHTARRAVGKGLPKFSKRIENRPFWERTA
mmetsp:Transcript_9649/g.9753  ORF Transcript_9649/g.9753 Transcript_9649/m.9753 type:complete len:200 (-) Transcript_9649:268-867(-)